MAQEVPGLRLYPTGMGLREESVGAVFLRSDRWTAGEAETAGVALQLLLIDV